MVLPLFAGKMKRQVNLFACWPGSSKRVDTDDSYRLSDSQDFAAEEVTSSPISPESEETICVSSQSSSNMSVSCTAVCCADPVSPARPSDRAFVDSTKLQIGQRSEFRCLNPQWYKDFL